MIIELMLSWLMVKLSVVLIDWLFGLVGIRLLRLWMVYRLLGLLVVMMFGRICELV